MPSRRLFFLPGLVFVALFLVSCGRRETAVSAGNRSQTLHWGNLTEPTDLDPHIITSQQDFNIAMELFEGLTAYDPKDLIPCRASPRNGNRARMA